MEIAHATALHPSSRTRQRTPSSARSCSTCRRRSGLARLRSELGHAVTLYDSGPVIELPDDDHHDRATDTPGVDRRPSARPLDPGRYGTPTRWCRSAASERGLTGDRRRLRAGLVAGRRAHLIPLHRPTAVPMRKGTAVGTQDSLTAGPAPGIGGQVGEGVTQRRPAELPPGRSACTRAVPGSIQTLDD
jgi:hypothetical protein